MAVVLLLLTVPSTVPLLLFVGTAQYMSPQAVASEKQVCGGGGGVAVGVDSAVVAVRGGGDIFFGVFVAVRADVVFSVLLLLLLFLLVVVVVVVVVVLAVAAVVAVVVLGIKQAGHVCK